MGRMNEMELRGLTAREVERLADRLTRTVQARGEERIGYTEATSESRRALLPHRIKPP